MTLSYCSTVVSPPLGVQCAATQSREHPVGKAMPASRPLAAMSLRTESSSVSQRSTILMPGLAILRMYVRTCRCTSAHCRTSLIMSSCSRCSSRFSSDVSRHRLLHAWPPRHAESRHRAQPDSRAAQSAGGAHSSLYDCHSPSGKRPSGKSSLTGTEGGSVCPPAVFFFFVFFFFFAPPFSCPASPPSASSSSAAAVAAPPFSAAAASALAFAFFFASRFFCDLVSACGHGRDQCCTQRSGEALWTATLAGGAHVCVIGAQFSDRRQHYPTNADRFWLG